MRIIATVEEVDDFLEHFGVRGMHWGSRGKSSGSESSQKKIVNPAKQAKREDKAKGFDSKAQKFQSNIDRIDLRLAKAKRRTATTDNLHATKAGFIKRKESALKNAEASRQGKLTSGQKKALAVGAVAGAIAAKILVDKYQKVQVKNLRLTNEQFISAKKLLDGKMQKRFKSLTDLSNMTTGDHPSRKGALIEINNLNAFYKFQLKKMADTHNITDKVLKKMDLGGFL